jgi:transcriptional regulator with XRE-family HTH domain
MIDGRLWTELGTTMRQVRGQAGVSLRDLENRGAWRRSTISQVENGKARPSRALIEWYDSELGSDGLLLSIYAEARSRQLLSRTTPDADTGDVVRLIDVDPPAGLLVKPGTRTAAHVTLSNDGTAPWRDRSLRRMGAYAGRRLIGSAPEVPVPETAPGSFAEVVVELSVPEISGSVIAYWTMVDASGRDCAPDCPPIAVLLVVE